MKAPFSHHMFFCFLFFVLQMSSVFCRSSLRTDRPTDIFSVRDSWIECRRTDSECFDVQFAVILLLSDFSSHTHVHNAPANWYKPGSSRMLAAVSSSIFIQVFFFSKHSTVKASYSGGRLATKWHFCGSLFSWKLFFRRRSVLLFFLQSMSKPAECEEVVTHDASTFTHTQFSWFLAASPAGHLSLWLYCTSSLSPPRCCLYSAASSNYCASLPLCVIRVDSQEH